MKTQNNFQKSRGIERQGSSRRSCGGQGSVELVLGLIVGIPLIIATIDLAYMGLGAAINDSVCIESARAAASGPPSTDVPTASHSVGAGQSPYQRAVAVIKTHSPTNLPIKVQDQPEIYEVVKDVPPKEMGGAVDGEISVKTTVVVMPPGLIGGLLGAGGVRLTSTHHIPFTYVVPQEQKPQPPAGG